MSNTVDDSKSSNKKFVNSKTSLHTYYIYVYHEPSMYQQVFKLEMKH